MKIIVDEMPESPRDCPFSERREAGPHRVYVCNLRPYIEEAGEKPRCLCKNVENCERLQPLDSFGR